MGSKNERIDASSCKYFSGLSFASKCNTTVFTQFAFYADGHFSCSARVFPNTSPNGHVIVVLSSFSNDNTFRRAHLKVCVAKV